MTPKPISTTDEWLSRLYLLLIHIVVVLVRQLNGWRLPEGMPRYELFMRSGPCCPPPSWLKVQLRKLDPELSIKERYRALARAYREEFCRWADDTDAAKWLGDRFYRLPAHERD